MRIFDRSMGEEQAYNLLKRQVANLPHFLAWAFVALFVPISASGADDDGLNALVHLLVDSNDDAVRLDLVTGILDGFEGRRDIDAPPLWPQAYAKLEGSADALLRERTLRLALIFDDPVALESLRARALDKAADREARNRAIQALVTKKVDGFATALLELVDDPATRSAALRGLAEYEHPETVSTILERFDSFDGAARRDAVQTMASRPVWAMALLDAVESNRVPRTDLTAYTARQLRELGDDRLTGRVKALWGEVRATPAAKRKLIENYKKKLIAESLESADRSMGRVIFQNVCASCHRLFDSGENIGPELTGSQRTNLDYLLENLVDPGASVSRDYQMQIIEVRGGRTITGIVSGETEATLTVRTINEQLVVPRAEIEKRTVSSVSIMPEGILQLLSADNVRDLIAYLSGPGQVPLKGSSFDWQSKNSWIKVR